MIHSLGDFVDLISGPAFKSKFFTDNANDIPLVKGDNLGQGFIAWDKSKYWPVDSSYEYEKYSLRPGDVVLAMDRPWVTAGLKFSRINDRDPKSFVVQRIARIRPKNGMTEDFLLCLVSSKEFELYIKNIMGGTNVPHVSGNQIRSYQFKVPVFNFSEIGEIFSNYNSLIQNNRRRIQLLEESARLLYKEWFVHLRFPGHEHVKITDGVPEGWVKSIVSDLGAVITGKTPSTKDEDNFGDEVPFIKTPDMHISSIVTFPEEFLSEKGAKSQPKKFLPPYSILVACIGAKLGVVTFNRNVAQTNQQINAVIPKKDFLRCFSYFLLESFKPRLQSIGGGATMPNVNKSKFSTLDYFLPTKSLLEMFESYAQSNFEQMAQLIEMNKKLKEARDILLPRLMNGELAV